MQGVVESEIFGLYQRYAYASTSANSACKENSDLASNGTHSIHRTEFISLLGKQGFLHLFAFVDFVMSFQVFLVVCIITLPFYSGIRDIASLSLLEPS